MATVPKSAEDPAVVVREFLANPESEGEIVAVLDCCLGAPNRAFQDVLAGLTEVIGDIDAAHLLIAELVKERDPYATDSPVPPLGELRLLRARFKPRLRRAYDHYTGDSDDWRSFQRELYLDALMREWIIHSRIEKANGEELFLATSVDSLVRLLLHFVGSLSRLPLGALTEDEAAEEFDALFENVAALRAKIEKAGAPDEEELPAEH